MKRLEKHFLDNVFDFAFASGVAAGGGEDTRLVLLQQRLETGGVATQHSRNQFRVRSFHSGGIWHSCRRHESGKPPRERGGFPVNPNQTVPESLGLPPAKGACLSADSGWRSTRAADRDALQPWPLIFWSARCALWFQRTPLQTQPFAARLQAKLVLANGGAAERFPPGGRCLSNRG